MAGFDWRDYSNLTEDSENHTSENLFEEYTTMVAKQLTKFRIEGDTKYSEKIIELVQEYKAITENSNKFAIKN